MGGSGGGGNSPQKDNSSKQWKAELQMQERMQQQQLDAQRQALNDQRAAEAAARAAEEAARQKVLDTNTANDAKKAADAAAQAAGSQATGVGIPAAQSVKLAAAAKTAPGLNPFQDAVQQSSKMGNSFYGNGQRLGGI